MSQPTELKPCPFCGESDSNEIETQAVVTFMPRRNEIWQHTNCNTCGAVGGKFRLGMDENPWNTRAHNTLKARIAELEGAEEQAAYEGAARMAEKLGYKFIARNIRQEGASR